MLGVQFQDAADGRVQLSLGYLPRPHGRGHVGAVVGPRPRHDQVEARGQARPVVVLGAPVAHVGTVEAPFVARERQKPGVLGAVRAVQQVVRRHHRPGPGLLHRDAERLQVQLVQRALVHDRVHDQPIRLLVVAGEVLERRSHAPALHALDVGGRQLAGQMRVLAVVLEVAAAQGAALHVHARPQHHGHALLARLVAQRLAHRAHEVRVERACRGARRGEAHGRLASRKPQVVRRSRLPPQAMGAVRHGNGGNAQARTAAQLPVALAREARAFLLKGHGRYGGGHIEGRCHGRSSPIRRRGRR